MDVKNLKIKCLENHIPILRDKTLLALEKVIFEKNIKTMFEIGTAWGYSSLSLKNKFPNLKIVSIEKNNQNFDKALKHLKKSKIKLINNDAFLYEPKEKYDLIFFDGPKKKQKILFEKYQNYLTSNGIIFIDNIFLKKYSDNKNLEPRKQKILDDLNNFLVYLKNLKNWEIKFYDVDDGYAICQRK